MPVGYEVDVPFDTIETVWPQGISMLPVVPGGLFGKQVTWVRLPELSTSSFRLTWAKSESMPVVGSTLAMAT